jgi:hypothetical protein
MCMLAERRVQLLWLNWWPPNSQGAVPCCQREIAIGCQQGEPSKSFCFRRAMYSSKARVAAAFLVRSPPTLTACSMSLGSKERFVAMCYLLHTNLHMRAQAYNVTDGVATKMLKRRAISCVDPRLTLTTVGHRVGKSRERRSQSRELFSIAAPL